MKSKDAFKLFCWLMLLSLSFFSEAQGASRVVFLSHEYPTSILKLRAKVQTVLNQDVETININNIDREIQANDLVVLLGRQALEASKKIPQEAITIGLLITKNDYLKYEAYLDSAVFSEPPLERNIQLARHILGEESKLGVLVLSKEDKTEFAIEENKRLKVFAVSEYDSINHALTNLFLESQALVGVYDQSLYSSQNIKNILITSYRQERPLIGPSRAYISAGALASTYSSLDDVANRLYDLINEVLLGNHVPEADYNPYYRVGVNEQVGRSLNLERLDPQSIARSLLQGG